MQPIVCILMAEDHDTDIVWTNLEVGIVSDPRPVLFTSVIPYESLLESIVMAILLTLDLPIFNLVCLAVII